ncbi:MAG: hypothetical protein V4722_23435 [Bacteroidota bacterium]
MKKDLFKTLALSAFILLAASSCKKTVFNAAVAPGIPADTLTISPIYTKSVNGVYESVYPGSDAANVFKLQLTKNGWFNFATNATFVYLSEENGNASACFPVPGASPSGSLYDLYWQNVHIDAPEAVIGRAGDSSDKIREIRVVFMSKTIWENSHVDCTDYPAMARHFGLN